MPDYYDVITFLLIMLMVVVGTAIVWSIVHVLYYGVREIWDFWLWVFRGGWRE